MGEARSPKIQQKTAHPREGPILGPEIRTIRMAVGPRSGTKRALQRNRKNRM